MSSPTRCLSSHITTFLLENLRNPQQGEERWIQGNENRGDTSVFISRVAVTEVASSLLCISASVESIAYGVLIIGAIPLCFFSSRPFNHACKLFTSSLFTVIWNLGNITSFNLFYINTVTHESFARYSMDHWPRGLLFKTLVNVSIFALFIFAIFSKEASLRNVYIAELPFLSFQTEYFNRTEDSLYIAAWCRSHHINTRNFDNINSLLVSLASHGTHINRAEDFINTNIFGDKTISQNTKSQVAIGYPTEAIFFVFSRLCYLCLSDQANDINIDLFRAENQLTIRDLKNTYSNETLRKIADYMISIENEGKKDNQLYFSNAEKALRNDQSAHALFNAIKGIATTEAQGSGILLKAYGGAAAAYNRSLAERA